VTPPVLARTRLGMTAGRKLLGSPIVLVPTMGALHEGHIALLRSAAALSRPYGSVVVSVFVNPLQFGAGEDLDRYPRDLDTDLAICEREGVALVFAPGDAQMYPREQLITVDPGPMGQVLEGASRPGFFTGVLTVVLKLFQLVGPQVAVFGEKDAQQLALIRRMTEDLCLGVEIASVPTVREPDGLAVSSRIRSLSCSISARDWVRNRSISAPSPAGAWPSRWWRSSSCRARAGSASPPDLEVPPGAPASRAVAGSALFWPTRPSGFSATWRYRVST